MLDFSVTCSHGYRNVDGDECKDCLELEVAKMQVLNTVEAMVREYTDEDDSTTRALVMTAAGHYVSMKLNRSQDSARVLNGIAAVIQQALPAHKEERMLAQQQFLTALSFEAYEPEELECLYSPTLAEKLSRWLRGKTLAISKRKLMQRSNRLQLQSKR
jgi:hypothetical protein